MGLRRSSRVIRVDAEVKAILDRERQSYERNYSDAIMRLVQRADELERAANGERKIVSLHD